VASIPAIGFALAFRRFGLYDLISGQLGLLAGLIATWGFGLVSYTITASFLRVGEVQTLKTLFIGRLRGSKVTQ
jgi:hypothetical protein